MNETSGYDASARGLRGVKWLFALLGVGLVLVATHQGEFYPYSIYPMFSQAGRPWNRCLVRVVDDVDPSVRWQTRTLETVHGTPLALSPLGIPQNDLTKLVKLTKEWDDERLDTLRGMFSGPLESHDLLVYRIFGDVNADGDTETRAEPLVYMSGTTSEVRPRVDIAQGVTQ